MNFMPSELNSAGTECSAQGMEINSKGGAEHSMGMELVSTGIE